MRGSKRPRPRWRRGTPWAASQSLAGSGALSPQSETSKRERSKRGNHHEKSRETPWMLDPRTPNLSHTWRTGTAIAGSGLRSVDGGSAAADHPDERAGEREQDHETGPDEGEREGARARQAELREVEGEEPLAQAPA